MSDILFPAGFIVDLSRLDVEKMQHYAKMWDVEHTQLGKGVFEGSLYGVHTPHIQLGTSHFSEAIMTQGSFPEGCIVLYYAASGTLHDTVYNFHNRTISPNEVVLLTNKDALDLLTHSVLDLRTVVVEERLFHTAFYDFFGETSSTPIKNKRLTLQTDKIALFHQTHMSWISYLAEEFPKLTNKPDYDSMESEILHQLFSCMISSSPAKRRKKFQTKIVRDMLHDHIDKNISIPMLSEGLNIGVSQLHQVFKKEYGISPKRYLMLLRLNAVRKALLFADPGSVSIFTIAEQYQLFHMGHFSAAYKQLFGETPSETLHRKP
ncbi:MAG: hypothetical protein COB07_07845 [Sulfurovum sp.]|nr:MAG: hypothetical protein COB07_07845 [Sulfurovum sp.]